MRFSVIMPTFKRPQVINRTIDTILRQTFRDWELIVVDNYGSNYRFTDPRIKYWVYNTPRGASHARNFGVSRVQGELVSFFDDDDEMLPHYLQRFHEAFLRPEIKMARCGMHLMREGINDFSFATPLVVLRRQYVTPTWGAGVCHDQVYYSQILNNNHWTGLDIHMIHETLVNVHAHPTGGCRDPEGKT